MEKGLEHIGAVPGVGGSFVCDNRGDVIVSSNPAVLATVTMHTIGREVGQAFAALEAAAEPATRIEFVYSNWRLLAQDIGSAVFFVVCHQEADMAMVRMTADVVIAGWSKDGNAQKRLQERRAERAALVSRTTLDQKSWSAWSVLSGGQV